MRRVVLPFIAFCCICTLVAAGAETPTAQLAPKTTETIPVSQIHTGMRGVAYTVFQGTKPEAMDVEVLGVLKNMNGPKATSFSSGCTAPKLSTRAWSPE